MAIAAFADLFHLSLRTLRSSFVACMVNVARLSQSLVTRISVYGKKKHINNILKFYKVLCVELANFKFL